MYVSLSQYISNQQSVISNQSSAISHQSSAIRPINIMAKDTDIQPITMEYNDIYREVCAIIDKSPTHDAVCG